MKTYNTNPYYDDFDDAKNFHQILFKPGEVVQARELTQLQTILRSQIEKFGNHVFKHGSLVIPGNSFVETGVPYIKIQTTIVDPSYLIGKKLTQAGGLVSALVKAVEPATSVNNFITLFLTYTSGSGSSSVNGFSEGVISVDASYSSLPSGSPVSINTVTGAFAGTGVLANVNDGVYYVNGSFAKVNRQTIVISKDDNEFSCRVALRIIESVVSAESDVSLLDPAQGIDNFAAPGADRVKIELKLVKLDINSLITDDYVELMRYRTGVLEEHTRYAKYSELEKSLARRTADESGDYTVSGFDLSAIEHLRTGYNNGVYSLAAGGDSDKAVINVTSGKAYIQGFEVEKLVSTKITIDKGKGSDHVMDDGKLILQTGSPTYIFITIDGLVLPNLQDFTNNVDLYGGSGIKIGSLTASAFEEEVDGIYRMYFTGLNLDAGNTIGSVFTIRSGSTIVGKPVTKLVLSNVSGIIPANSLITNQSGRSAVCIVHSSLFPNIVWAVKTNAISTMPIIGDYVTAGSVSSTVSSITSVVTNTATPIYRIPGKVSTLANNTGSYDVAYNAMYFGSSTTTTPMTIPVGSGVFEYTDAQTARAPIAADSTQHPDGITVSNTTTDVAYSVSVRKTNVAPKSKTKTTVSQTINGFSLAMPTGTIIELANVDGLGLKSVTYVSSGNTIDITTSFIFNDGQTDEYYDYAKILYKGGLTGTVNLSVTYEYFSHVDHYGDYFCIDSYPVEYRDRLVTYVASTGEKYDLLNCLDFRKSVVNQSVNTTVAKFTQLKPDTFITTSFSYYVPRIDGVYLTKNGDIVVQKGIPANKPKKTRVPNDVLSLGTVFVPGNSKFASSFKVKREKNQRYTMSDIRKLETRVKNIEEFSVLSATENSLLTYEVKDSSSGLNKFKTGYLVENFDRPTAVSDFFNELNRCTIANGVMTSAIEVHEAPLTTIDLDSAGYQNTGGLVTAKYTERALIDQNTSTRVTNVNPFMVFNWEGSLTISPTADVWAEVEDLPTIFGSREEVIEVIREEPCPPMPVPVPTPGTAPVIPVGSVTLYDIPVSSHSSVSYNREDGTPTIIPEAIAIQDPVIAWDWHDSPEPASTPEPYYLNLVGYTSDDSPDNYGFGYGDSDSSDSSSGSGSSSGGGD